ncbi:MAG: hypothetical protein QXP06_07480 [Candidatus Bathyarchaeia archaeon]
MSEKELFVPRVYSIPCFDFIDENGIKQRVTAILAPIKLKMAENGSLLISWACNRAESCQNATCRYSKKEA